MFYALENNKPVKIEAGEFKGSQVIEQEVIEGYLVSTVFLGLEHHGGMFETMIFEDNGQFVDLYMDRCETYEEALNQHKQAVDTVFEGKL